MIKEKGLSYTQAREELIDLFLHASTPLSYDNIKNSLSMDKATFYRNTALFEAAEIISSFESNDKKRYYSIEQNLHPHFICTCCNSIECLHEDTLYKLKGYKIESITIKGLCPKCHKNE